MLEKPNIPDERIIARLQASYGIPIAGIDFLPVGNDASAWLYRVIADDQLVYFLKVKQGPVYQPSVLVPRYLKDSGMAQVVAQ